MNCFYDSFLLCPYADEILLDDPDFCCIFEEDVEK